MTGTGVAAVGRGIGPEGALRRGARRLGEWREHACRLLDGMDEAVVAASETRDGRIAVLAAGIPCSRTLTGERAADRPERA
jgi:hypothetical protein